MQAPNRHVTRVVVMASGTGSNLQAVLDACTAGELRAEVVAVVSDNDNAYALKRAADAGVPSVHVGRHPGEALAGERTRTGVMVHRVPDEGIDDGPVLASVEVPINLDDTFESFQARIHA